MNLNSLTKFKTLEISKDELEKSIGNPFAIQVTNPVVVEACDVICVLEKYKNNLIGKKELLEWTNIIWFTDLFDYAENDETNIANVMFELEQLDETTNSLTNDDVDKLILMLHKNS